MTAHGQNNMDKTKEAFEVAKFIGIVGFGAGFIGPAIVSPGSNQGPLFGIIISGPLSFLYGLFVGFLPAMFPIFKNVRYDMRKFTGALICAAAVMGYVIASK
jgi:hypothetical protein